VDGKGVGDVGSAVLKERRILGDEGMVIVVLVVDSETGSVLQGLIKKVDRSAVCESKQSL